MRAGVDFPGHPGVDLAVLREHPLRPDQARRVEDMARPAFGRFQKRTGLDVDAQLLCLAHISIRVFVGDRNGQSVSQFFDRRDRSAPRERTRGTPPVARRETARSR